MKFQIGDLAVPSLTSWSNFRDSGEVISIRNVRKNGRVDVYWNQLQLNQYDIDPEWFEPIETYRVKRILSYYD
jgi:hypothetical protein